MTLATWMPCSNNWGVRHNISSHLLWLLGNVLITSVHLFEAALSVLACCLVFNVTVRLQYLKRRQCNTTHCNELKFTVMWKQHNNMHNARKQIHIFKYTEFKKTYSIFTYIWLVLDGRYSRLVIWWTHTFFACNYSVKSMKDSLRVIFYLHRLFILIDFRGLKKQNYTAFHQKGTNLEILRL